MNDDTKKVETEELESMDVCTKRKEKIRKIGFYGRPITEMVGGAALGTLVASEAKCCIKIGGVKHRVLFAVGTSVLTGILQYALHNPNERMWDDIEGTLNGLCDMYDDYKKSKALGISFKEYVKINYPDPVTEA